MQQLDWARTTDVEVSGGDDALGARLRARRKALGRTMQQVADDAGLTIGFISQVERGISKPSLSSLYNLAKALDASVDMFVTQSPAGKHSVVTHAGKRPLFEAGRGNTRFYEFLERGFPEAKLNACLTHVLPGHASEMMSHEGEDFIYLVAGTMLYEVDGVTYELNAGDTLHFDSHKPHRRTNIGGDTAVGAVGGHHAVVRAMSPLDVTTAKALNAALADGRDALVGVLNRLFLSLPGVRTVTYLTIDLDRKETRRIGTSQGQGFPAGFAEAIPDAWFQGICVEKRALIGDNPEQMAEFLPETPELVAAGYGATMCAPIVIAGVARGTVNLLGDAGIFTPAMLADFNALLPIAALLFTFEESGTR